MFQLKCIWCLTCPIFVLIGAKISNILCSSMFLILHKLGPSTKTQMPLEVKTMFLHQSPWYLAIHLTAANMKCPGPLSAPALFQGCVRQQGTTFLRFEISQSISCFFWSMVITWVNDNPQKWHYRPSKVEMTYCWSVGEIWRKLNFSFRFCPPSKRRKTAGWPVKTSTCAPTTPSWAQKTL